MRKQLFLWIFFLVVSKIGFAQEAFFESDSQGENFKTQYYFHKKIPFKGVYYYNDGKIKYFWIKKNRRLGIDNSTFTYYKYDLDSTVTEITLYCEIRTDLTVVVFAPWYKKFGFFTKTETAGNTQKKYSGSVKLLTKQRKFDVSEVSKAPIELEVNSTETIQTYYVEADQRALPLKSDADKVIITNFNPTSVDQTGYFEIIYTNGKVIYEGNVSIVKTDAGRIEVATTPTRQTISEFDNKGWLISKKLKILKSSKFAIYQESNHQYVEPFVEIIDTYRYNKKGEKKLIFSIEIQNTYFN